ncbi:hypothetical protein BdWA1_003090 [Babesia duncani]|uniref:Uncharacterized protein n=1 Tax=Babesia duncani TaxID=323732 RepID=A0AAD9UN00_9APIC|nr:hypothetical protein BdWA1_003090 [Babesia duncani]
MLSLDLDTVQGSANAYESNLCWIYPGEIVITKQLVLSTFMGILSLFVVDSSLVISLLIPYIRSDLWLDIKRLEEYTHKSQFVFFLVVEVLYLVILYSALLLVALSRKNVLFCKGLEAWSLVGIVLLFLSLPQISAGWQIRITSRMLMALFVQVLTVRDTSN